MSSATRALGHIPPSEASLEQGGGGSVRDLAAVVEAVPRDVPIILLDRQPRKAQNAAKLGVALQLSGHIHGGLIVGPDRLAARPNGGFVSGRYDVDGMTLYVNNGTASWLGFALRLGRPSELTRITLRRAGATQRADAFISEEPRRGAQMEQRTIAASLRTLAGRR